jgi:hypothetical protein
MARKVGERLAASKRTTQKFDMKSSNFGKLKKVEGKEQYHAKISNKFTALKNLDDNVDNNRASETTGGNTRILGK